MRSAASEASPLQRVVRRPCLSDAVESKVLKETGEGIVEHSPGRSASVAEDNDLVSPIEFVRYRVECVNVDHPCAPDRNADVLPEVAERVYEPGAKKAATVRRVVVKLRQIALEPRDLNRPGFSGDSNS
jgi:hypothetical protein